VSWRGSGVYDSLSEKHMADISEVGASRQSLIKAEHSHFDHTNIMFVLFRMVVSHPVV